ncbi:MAG: hypothetical protein JJU36_16325 [Phycisphaeraceae bacterium]|nr:hypothetical protein [Phycisphaeraceae bacterium]
MACAVSSVIAHDLNPAPYRGQELSVFAHWQAELDGWPSSPQQFSDGGSSDPAYFLSQLSPQSVEVEQFGQRILVLQVPNFIDDLPLKLLRLQVTWTGSGAPNIGQLIGVDGNNSILGTVVDAPPIVPFASPPGGYRYFDIEFRPNPDYEIIELLLPMDMVIEQVVVDSISIPEPSAILIGVLGPALFIRRRQNR